MNGRAQLSTFPIRDLNPLSFENGDLKCCPRTHFLLVSYFSFFTPLIGHFCLFFFRSIESRRNVQPLSFPILVICVSIRNQRNCAGWSEGSPVQLGGIQKTLDTQVTQATQETL